MLDLILLNNSLQRWMLALLGMGAVLAGVTLWRWVVIHRPPPVLLRTNTFLDDIPLTLAKTISAPIIVLLAAYSGSAVLNLGNELQTGLRAVAIIAALVQVGSWGNALIQRWVARYDERNRATNTANVGSARLLALFGRIGLYSIVLLLILDNIPGVEVTALVASLGIGGVAVALATQNILGDIFASLSIALDKPFVVSDTIMVGDDVGTVEMIGLKTTRLRSLSGEQLIFSNGDLLSSRIRNFARQEQRRVVFSFRVAYSTPPEQLRTIPTMLRAIIEPIEQTRFDRAHLLRFDDLGLLYEVVYHVLTPDFGRYMDIQQQINLALIEQLAAADVSLASLAEPLTADPRTRSSTLSRRRSYRPRADRP